MASSGGSRRSESDVAGFTASPQLAQALQQIVVDLVELHLQGKQAHWNVVGHNFRDLHLQLDQIVDDARESADTIAERMRALASVPDGRSETVAATTTLPAFPAGEANVSTVVDLVTARLRATVDTLRTLHDQVDSEDPATADLLHTIIDSLEKHAWMVSAENRSA
ncbi:Dps family protein [Streptomyces rugosispiralis]|uniref:DNA starvation/stationary phase protection protein n=1 Tax=Streptomyces rugosispiralis TaxID=2967341 RepID=A0ABT1V3A1_9ACTN|nr:DNA starvation/stationary phase protection protein [Streptomyces rugosispiralis]MCQ8191859.1 DNA starvation/stationary phase protection protein [Streptomyces rugosispiralis]